MVDAQFVKRCPVRQAGGETIPELCVPAVELEEFNRHVVGVIEGAHELRPSA